MNSPTFLWLAKSRAGWVIGALSLLIVLAVAGLLLLPRATVDGRLELEALPLLNAVLNGASAIMLVAGYSFIRRRPIGRTTIRAHRLCMLAAFGLSSAFLVSYVIYHALAGSTPFTGTGWVRPLYFALLISHIVLAALLPFLALTTLFYGLRGWLVRGAGYRTHRRIARRALPLWLYVSVTGVIIYLMLYHLA